MKQSYTAEDLQGRLIPVEDLSGMQAKDAKAALQNQGLEAVFRGDGETVTDQIPSPGQSLPGGSQVIVYLGEKNVQQPVKVPDFSGMTRQQASDAAGLLGLYILPKGNLELTPTVKAVAQSVPAGAELQTGATVTITFSDTKTIP